MKKVTVPMYYADFICKCGECRHPCCKGWAVNISRREYFTYIGMACSDGLRSKLDCAFDIDSLPTEECFAKIRHNYLGDCPMLRSDGLCDMQYELGEEKIPLICRVYPRSVKRCSGGYELCTSNSCEKTIELLLESNCDFYLTESDILPPFEGLELYGESEEKDRIRHMIITAVANSGKSIKDRIAEIGEICGLRICEANATKECAVEEITKFIGSVCRKSESMDEYGEKYILPLREKEAFTAYASAEKYLYETVPEFDAFFAKVIANHALYEGFPYVNGTESVSVAYGAFVTACAAMKAFAVLCMAKGGDIKLLTDVLAASGRFFEHSDYYKSFGKISHAEGTDIFSDFADIF